MHKRLERWPRRSTRVARERRGRSSAPASNPPTAMDLGEARFRLIREAQRVAGLRQIKAAEVVNRAAKGRPPVARGSDVN